MRFLLRIAPFVVVGLLSAACPSSPLSRATTDNPEVTASVIAHVNGITVYRLNVGDRTIYFTDARGTTSWTELQGKILTPIEVETIR